MATSSQTIGGSVTADLNFWTKIGDFIRLRGTSDYDNADASVLI